MLTKQNAALPAILLVATAIWTASCDKDPIAMYGEQYKKTLYIVHANGIEHSREHAFENENDTITLSVYCASSEPISGDVTATLEKDPKILDSVNYLNGLGNANYVAKLMLEPERYSFERGTVTIRAGRQFGLLKIPVRLAGIDLDKEYILPVTLQSNDAGYDINPQLRSIAYQPVMVNRFSGMYTGTSKVSTENAPRSISPRLQAMAKNQIRLPIHNLPDDSDLLSTNFMLLTVQADGRSVSIAPFRDAQVSDEGGSTYDPELKQFTLNYSYTDGNAKRTVQSIVRDVALSEE